MDQAATATRDPTNIPPHHCPHPTDSKRKEEPHHLFHSATTVLPLPVTSISYKKFIHDLDLQVSVMGGLAKVQILTNKMDSEQYPVGVLWMTQRCQSTVRPAVWLSEELHLIRHLGAGGAEVRPGTEGSSGEVLTGPLRPPSLGSVPQKRPSGTGHTPREYELCCACARVWVHEVGRRARPNT